MSYCTALSVFLSMLYNSVALLFTVLNPHEAKGVNILDNTNLPLLALTNSSFTPTGTFQYIV